MIGGQPMVLLCDPDNEAQLGAFSSGSGGLADAPGACPFPSLEPSSSPGSTRALCLGGL